MVNQWPDLESDLDELLSVCEVIKMVVMPKWGTGRLEVGLLLRIHHFRRSFRQLELVYTGLEFCRSRCDLSVVW